MPPTAPLTPWLTPPAKPPAVLKPPPTEPPTPPTRPPGLAPAEAAEVLLLVALAPLRLAVTSVLDVVEAPPCAAGSSANAFAASASTAQKSIVDVLMIETPVGTHTARPPRSLKCRLT